MDESRTLRLTRFSVRTLFVLTAVVAVALAIPNWIRDWQIRQHEPIRQAIAASQFLGEPPYFPQSVGSWHRHDIFGDECSFRISPIESVGFFSAEASAGLHCLDGRSASVQGFRYQLARKRGRWIVTERSPTDVACGIRGPYPDEVWANAAELIRLSREGDLATRKKAFIIV
jgi:hypothetical protein